jgi:hypothetical protein
MDIEKKYLVSETYIPSNIKKRKLKEILKRLADGSIDETDAEMRIDKLIQVSYDEGYEEGDRDGRRSNNSGGGCRY